MATTPDLILLQRPRYIRAKLYAELSGITVEAQRKKRIAGHWLAGREYVIAPDGQVMIDWAAVDRWAEGKQ